MFAAFIKTMKNHVSLIPLVGCGVVGALGSSLYLLRLATKSPTVTWSAKKNPEPFQDYKEKPYKLYANIPAPTKCPAPEY